MSEYKVPNIRIFGSDEGWETLFERSYNFKLVSSEDGERAAEEGELLIRDFVEKNDFLLSQNKEKREDFLLLALACNKLAARQNADLDIRFHAEEKMMCVRIFSPIFMLTCPDISRLNNIGLGASYMEIEALDDEEKRTRISAGLSFDDQSASLIECYRNIVSEIEQNLPQE